MTREAFLNAIRVVMALGGSTNAVLHLIAIAHEAEVDLSIDDFNPIAATTPTLADLKPSGRYVMKDLDLVGGAGIIADVALITDGRFSGGSHGIVVGHMAPEAQAGGPIAAIEEGDIITIDLDAATIDVDLAPAVLQSRLDALPQREIPYRRGALAKYARLVSSASLGAITH